MDIMTSIGLVFGTVVVAVIMLMAAIFTCSSANMP
jgi:hypothetical protein